MSLRAIIASVRARINGSVHPQTKAVAKQAITEVKDAYEGKDKQAPVVKAERNGASALGCCFEPVMWGPGWGGGWGGGGWGHHHHGGWGGGHHHHR